jgi:hypothetical protein
LIREVRHAMRQSYPLSINLECYEDGTVSPRSLALLKKVRRAVRGRQA